MTRKAILNLGASAGSSRVRTIAEYAGRIWHVDACPVT